MWIFSIENIDIIMELSCVELDHFNCISIPQLWYFLSSLFFSLSLSNVLNLLLIQSAIYVNFFNWKYWYFHGVKLCRTWSFYERFVNCVPIPQLWYFFIKLIFQFISLKLFELITDLVSYLCEFFQLKILIFSWSKVVSNSAILRAFR